MSEMTVRQCLLGHDWVAPRTYSDGLDGNLNESIIGKRFEAGLIAACACGWSSPHPDALHCYAAFITHLSERMYAAIAILDDCDSEFTSTHETGAPIRVRRLVPEREIEASDGVDLPLGRRDGAAMERPDA